MFVGKEMNKQPTATEKYDLQAAQKKPYLRVWVLITIACMCMHSIAVHVNSELAQLQKWLT